MSVVKDPIINKIFDIIDASDGGAIKSYFYGDPLVIGKSDLPALIGTKDVTEISDETNAEDSHKIRIVLTLVIDIRDYVGDAIVNVEAGDQKLYDIMEGRNADYTLKTTSIVDILRKSASLANNLDIDMNIPMNIDYGFTFGKRGEKSWSYEANLTITLFFHQLRG